MHCEQKCVAFQQPWYTKLGPLCFRRSAFGTVAMAYNHWDSDVDSEEGMGYWMNEEDLGDLDHFYMLGNHRKKQSISPAWP